MIGCAGTTGGLKILEEPNEGNCIIIGNVIIENINQEFSWTNWDFSSQVVIVGKSSDGTMNHYTVGTDAQGYYCLPNVPEGQYALKAVIIPIFGGMPLKLVNDLTENNSNFYRMRHPERPIEYTADWLPLKGEGRIVNLDIMWLGLRSAQVADLDVKAIGKIFVQKYSQGLKNKRFYEQGYTYTREDPLSYFKNKFPDSAWWK